MPGKKIRAAITSEKKNSCKQTESTNSLEKKIRAEVKCIKKNPAENAELKLTNV
jgi:hypothetical protein